MMSKEYHRPVLLQACMDGLAIRPDGVYVDVTFGGGGHSKEILKHLSDKGKLYAFDQDADAKANVPADTRLQFVPQNFRFMQNFLRLYGVTQVDGILADLGVSSHQFDEPGRGFSIRFEGPLDMRMNQSQGLTASQVVNTYEEHRLKQLFREWGEVDNAHRLASCIVKERAVQPLESIEQFKAAIQPCMPRFHEHKYLAKVFQALRMEVNGELEVLSSFLLQAKELLKPEGRIVVISYHSLEDRLVKNLLKTGNLEGEVKKDFFGHIERPFDLINKKPIEPSEQEIQENTRARSARLRIAAKVKHGK